MVDSSRPEFVLKDLSGSSALKQGIVGLRALRYGPIDLRQGSCYISSKIEQAAMFSRNDGAR